MRVRIRGSSVDGVVQAPPSKSYTQRAIVGALLADGKTEIVNPSKSEDGLSALGAARLLGAKVVEQEGSWILSGGRIETPDDIINCGGSATTIRLFTAVSALAPGVTVLTGSDSLRRRPMAELLSAMNSIGASCYSTRRNGLPPIVVLGGGIDGGEVEMRGDVSSQFVSALLFACTKARKTTTVRLTTPLESRHYVEMTVEALQRFGAEVRANFEDGSFQITGKQTLHSCRYVVEGDYSSVSFMIAAGLLGGSVDVQGLSSSSRQGDRAIVDLLMKMGGNLILSSDGVLATKSCLHGLELDARHIPDLVPILAVAASQATGRTTITGVGRLRLKESDRIKTTVGVLNEMGASISAPEDAIVVEGGAPLMGKTINPSDDHRIAMACAVAALVARGATVIEDAECVSKSYPSFFEDLKRLGADVEVEAG
jgi:3-phosphoshikimate 1-carboxyvinyltransferase